jgi:two-component system phosphate regulon response regulator PhoB
MPRILIVEDEPDITEVLSYNLRQAGFEVSTAGEGEEGLRLAGEKTPDLIVLDLMLPGMDGLELCRLLKQRDPLRRVPVVMLTAKAEEVDRIVGLELGADDYVTKPFSPRELVLRIKAILRRAAARNGEGEEEGRIEIGPLTIDVTAYQVAVGERPVELTATEFRLLHTLVRRRGRVQTRDELLEVVWGYQYSGYGRTVDTHIRRLREKLGEASDWVETVRGVGYRFRKESG